ncbi:MAG: molybdopterin converting factor subunit 1 [Oxalobacteraceae bacterium]|nr:molybdopterin converting factor subunit 1 [Oxalobacteraceae bacterium]
MQIQLKFFASLREALGTGGETVALPPEVKTAGDVREFLRSRGGVWAEALADGKALRVACNQQMADAATPLKEGCELAFFPPVTGG